MNQARDRIVATYGEKTAAAMVDFLDHAQQATWALSERTHVDPIAAEMMAESIALRLGESLYRAGRQFVDDNKDVALPQIVATRNVVAHGYDSVDHQLIWDAIENDLPAAVQRVQELLGR
ncbi:MAG: DUF86 domain-containing protein [Cellulomonadaceae bacterium]|jgi:uncharacterized protein with HEPN domain|nr:DUF86 domain-containing protein [Cellulomonadaceae bacterium]